MGKRTEGMKKQAQELIEQACHEDKMKVLEKIESELWMKGMNMDGEYQGIWVRFRDIERIIDKYKTESEG